MSDPSTRSVSKAEFLSRIRGEMRKTPGRFAAITAERPADPVAAADLVRRELAERWPETLERFRLELECVGGVFHRVPGPGAVAGVVCAIARARDVRRIVAWSPRALGLDVAPALTAEFAVTSMPDGTPASDAERAALRLTIAEADLGVTGADLAIGETGSLVLLSGHGRPRTTSLLPAYHVAVFDRSVLVESLPQVGIFLEAWHGRGAPPWRGGAITIITGPSRTADIELTLTRGVHGPKEVHAVFVESGLPAGELQVVSSRS